MKKKILTENEKIKNRLTIELYNMISEHKNGCLTPEIIYCYFSKMMTDANVDTDIVIKVLEDKRFGVLGQNEAGNIKVKYGY